MNKIKLLSLGALMVTAMYANAQTTAHTKPTGYVTHTLKAGQFNLIGLTLHNPVVASGDIQGFTGGTQITDSDVNFANVLTAGKTYILEITDAADTSLNGTIQEVTVWGANTFDTPQNLEAEGLAVGDKYQLRACKTISDIFGADNSADLQPTDEFKADEADLIYVPNGSGFDKYFYSNLTGALGWYKSDFSPADDAVLPYMDAIFVFRRASTDLKLVLTGSVKTISTTLALGGGTFNYITTVFPAGATLGNSGLDFNLTPTDEFKADEADLVYMPNGSGGYDKYFYSNLTGAIGWYKSDFSAANNTAMKPGVIVLRRGAAVNVTLTPPSSYSNL